MEYGIPLTPDSHTVDFSDDAITSFDNTLAVSEGLRRKYDDIEYEANTNIYALAEYSWNEPDSGTTGITTRLADKADITSTAVPCTQNVTVVYVIDSYQDEAVPKDVVGKYFLYIAANADVDFTTIDVTNPSDWDEVINKRYWDVIPDENSIYWETINTVNTKRLIDGKIFTQTVAPTSSMEHKFYFTTYVNTIAIFNMECDEVNITVNAWDGAAYTNEVHNETIDLIDLSGIASSYAWHYTPLDKFKTRLLERIPMYPKIEIVITFTKTATDPKVGEVVFARTETSGKTHDKPKGTKRTFDITSQDASGQRTVIKSDKIIDTIAYRVSIPVNSIDAIIQKWGELINVNILIIGDETGEFTTLINYAYIKELPYEIATNWTQNTYEITVNTLI